MIATECAHGSLHVNEEAVWLELVRPDGTPTRPGERGEVLVTLLHNLEFPLLRYRLGDSACLLPGACGCGVTLPRLDVSVCRAEELVVRDDGRGIHCRFLRTIYEAHFGPELRAFHTFQEAVGRFVAYLELDASPSDGVAAELAAAIQPYVGGRPEMRVVVGGATERSRLPSGKLASFTRDPFLEWRI